MKYNRQRRLRRVAIRRALLEENMRREQEKRRDFRGDWNRVPQNPQVTKQDALMREIKRLHTTLILAIIFATCAIVSGIFAWISTKLNATYSTWWINFLIVITGICVVTTLVYILNASSFQKRQNL